MALPSTGVIEVRSATGSDSNGGGFNSSRGGTDYSQQDAPQATGTVTSSGATVTATTGIFTSQMVGNYISDGTTTREITAFTSSTVVTVDSAPAWTAATVNVGGALATIVRAIAIGVTRNYVWCKGATFTLTGTVKTLAGYIQWNGYSVTRGDGGLAVFDASGMTAGNNTFSLSDHAVVNSFKVTGSKGVSFNGGSQCCVVNCYSVSSTGYGFGAIQAARYCLAYGGAGGFSMSAGSSAFGCVSIGSTTGHGFLSSANGNQQTFVNCIALNSGSSGTIHGFSANEAAAFINCVAYGSRNNGFNWADMTGAVNCVAVNNGGYGFAGSTSNGDRNGVVNTYGYNNTSGVSSGLVSPFEMVTALTGNPYDTAAIAALGSSSTLADVYAAFRPNNTAGAGASLRAAGFIPYQDVGAVQSQSTGGGGGVSGARIFTGF